ncbi:MAG: hypothetical protein B7Y45_11825 [Sphingomonas sp. 28-66-16]|nr:MAG: hypothetical protein B7Y45_11825 [Sphingomonas sp. 28-66-16]
MPVDDVALSHRLIAFIERIGIRVGTGALDHDCFLPGVTVRGGGIVHDPVRLAHPGDLLHEAGHIAVTDPEARATLDTVSGDPGEEMAAIAWSYAAALAIGIDPAIVFHADGYGGDGRGIADNFAAGRYFGVPLLAWFGMTVDPRSGASGSACYPQMTRWLR